VTSKREYRFSIVLTPDEGSYAVSVPSLPGCFSQGQTIGEAIENAKEAIALHIECMLEDGEAIPEEDEPVQAVQVKVAA
jgi:antitoxin HicB